MAILEFPPVVDATDDGLLALGGDLEVESLILAYSSGVFPWPISKDYPLAWFAPDPRGVIFSDKVHISKSLKKVLNKDLFTVHYNKNFEEVIRNCASTNNRKDIGTWITEDMIQAYIRLHKKGFAYSVETYFKDKLVGGLYGVTIGRMISGESMFYKEPNASKVAFVTLMQRMQQFNIPWMDTQMVTPVTRSLGAEEISRDNFMKLLSMAIQRPAKRGLFKN